MKAEIINGGKIKLSGSPSDELILDNFIGKLELVKTPTGFYLKVPTIHEGKQSYVFHKSREEFEVRQDTDEEILKRHCRYNWIMKKLGIT